MTPEQAATHVGRRLGIATEPGTRLHGGHLNHVFRVPTDRGSVVLKHAPPHVAAAPDIPLDPERLRFEARALRRLAPDGPLGHVPTAAVRPPRLLDHDPEAHALILEDVGPLPALDAWLVDGGDPEGLHALGAFVGRLHREGAPDPAMDNGDVQRTRFAVQYDAIEGFLRDQGVDDARALGQRARDLGRRFLERGTCLIMGDLWPASVLVGDALRIIDWEFAHAGRPAQDLGHLAAHLWMLRHRRDAPIDAWRAFAAGYRAERIPDDLDREQTALHFACEVLARSVGPFTEGCPYEGLAPDHLAVREAVHTAAEALRRARLPTAW